MTGASAPVSTPCPGLNSLPRSQLPAPVIVCAMSGGRCWVSQHCMASASGADAGHMDGQGHGC